MMLKLVVFCVMIGAACAATITRPTPKKPAHLAHKEGCYVEEVKDVIPYGSNITPPDQCVTIHCGRDMLDYATCGVISTKDYRCYTTKPFLGKPHPECCPTIKCETDNDV